MGVSTTINLLLKPYSKFIVYVIAFAIASIFGYWLYKTYAMPAILTKNKQYNDIANRKPASANSDIEILFFHASWCPHCKTCEPHWQKFSSKYNKSEFKNHRIICVDIETTSENDDTVELVKKYKVDGIPLIIALVDEEIITFEGKITTETLEAFLEELT